MSDNPNEEHTQAMSSASSVSTTTRMNHAILVGEIQNAVQQTVVGKSVGAYDPKSMPWTMYEQLLRYQLEVRGITDEKAKKLTIMTEIGPRAYIELVNSLEGKEIKDVATADELLAVLKKRFSPKKLLIAERHHLLLLKQDAGQTLAEFYSKIQEAAGTCDFENKPMKESYVVQVFGEGNPQ